MEYELIYRTDAQNGTPTEPTSTPVPGDIIHLIEHINTSPVDAAKLRLWTDRDPVVSQVNQFLLNGWPATVQGPDLQPYFTRKDELSVHGGRIMRGALVIVPPQGRDEETNILHDSHPGIV